MNRRVESSGTAAMFELGWKKSSSGVYSHVLQTTSRKKISRRGRVRQRNLPSSVLRVQNLCLTFKTFCFLTQLVSLLSLSFLLNPLSFIDVCKLLEIRMRFFVWRLYERLRSDPNTLNKISPESLNRNIYESSSVTVAPTRTIQWYLSLLYANLWFLYRHLSHYFQPRKIPMLTLM